MRYFICSDIHSFYDEWIKALKNAGYVQEHDTLVVLGDLLDRGPKPLECLTYLNTIQNKITIRGNHEDLFDDLQKRGRFLSHDWHNGTVDTVLTLASPDPKLHEYEQINTAWNHPAYQEYRSGLVDYFETDKAVFVHGWIPDTENWREGDWSEARWLNGMKMWRDGVRVDGKTVFCGHWHTSWGHHFIEESSPEFSRSTTDKVDWSPFINEGIVAVDACTAASGIVNVYIWEE